VIGVVAVAADNRDETRERVLAVLYELPGPDGFRGPRLARVLVDDALGELAATSGPISNDAARRGYEQRIANRAKARDRGDR
jgi:hypothetical protein